VWGFLANVVSTEFLLILIIEGAKVRFDIMKFSVESSEIVVSIDVYHYKSSIKLSNPIRYLPLLGSRVLSITRNP
jgi:hypothetical protein